MSLLAQAKLMITFFRLRCASRLRAVNQSFAILQSAMREFARDLDLSRSRVVVDRHVYQRKIPYHQRAQAIARRVYT